jgi:hypothetical protein
MYDISRLSFLVFPPLLLSITSFAQQTSVARILIYSATRDFRHDSIPTAMQAMKANQSAINAEFDNTEDPTQFNDQVLAEYDALLFLDNTGEGGIPERLYSWNR